MAATDEGECDLAEDFVLRTGTVRGNEPQVENHGN